MTEKQRLGQPLFPSLKDDARVTEDEPLTLKVGLELLNISKRMEGARQSFLHITNSWLRCMT